MGYLALAFTSFLGGAVIMLLVVLSVVLSRGVTDPIELMVVDRGVSRSPQAVVEATPPIVEPQPTAATADAKPRVQAAPAAEGPRFNGRPIRRARTVSMLVTGYSPDERSCGKSADGITASGYSVWTNGMKMVAADTRVLPFGSLVSIPGYNRGQPVPVLDRGGKIKGNRLDLLFATHEQARKWGVRRLTVTVWTYADRG